MDGSQPEGETAGEVPRGGLGGRVLSEGKALDALGGPVFIQDCHTPVPRLPGGAGDLEQQGAGPRPPRSVKAGASRMAQRTAGDHAQPGGDWRTGEARGPGRWMGGDHLADGAKPSACDRKDPSEP